MREIFRKSGGFTLLEITVVSAIIILLSVIVFANYREGDKQFALQRSAHKLAQDLRRAQEMAISSKEFQGTFPRGGYGIFFKKDSQNYILFADCNGDNKYNEFGAALSCALSSPLNPYPEKIEEFSLEKKIKINDLSPSSRQNILEIIFFPPDPTVIINPDAESASVVLAADGARKTIIVNTAGLIDIE